MSYINKKVRVFRTIADNKPEKKRSDARMKQYISVTDARAWCAIIEDRRQYILEMIRHGAEKENPYTGNLLATENLLKIMLSKRETELPVDKDKTKNWVNATSFTKGDAPEDEFGNQVKSENEFGKQMKVGSEHEFGKQIKVKPENGFSQIKVKPENDFGNQIKVKPENELSQIKVKPENEFSQINVKPENEFSQINVKPENEFGKQIKVKSENEFGKQVKVKSENEFGKQIKGKPENEFSQIKVKSENEFGNQIKTKGEVEDDAIPVKRRERSKTKGEVEDYAVSVQKRESSMNATSMSSGDDTSDENRNVKNAKTDLSENYLSIKSSSRSDDDNSDGTEIYKDGHVLDDFESHYEGHDFGFLPETHSKGRNLGSATFRHVCICPDMVANQRSCHTTCSAKIKYTQEEGKLAVKLIRQNTELTQRLYREKDQSKRKVEELQSILNKINRELCSEKEKNRTLIDRYANQTRTVQSLKMERDLAIPRKCEQNCCSNFCAKLKCVPGAPERVSILKALPHICAEVRVLGKKDESQENNKNCKCSNKSCSYSIDA